MMFGVIGHKFCLFRIIKICKEKNVLHKSKINYLEVNVFGVWKHTSNYTFY